MPRRQEVAFVKEDATFPLTTYASSLGSTLKRSMHDLEVFFTEKVRNMRRVGTHSLPEHTK